MIGKEGRNKEAHCAKVDEVSPHQLRVPRYSAFHRRPVASNVLANSSDERKKEEKAAKDQYKCNACTVYDPVTCANHGPKAGE